MAKAKQSSTRDSAVEELEASLRQQKFAPVYLLHGEEDFLLDQALNQLIDAALDESARSFNLDVVHGNDIEAKDIVSLASAFPMMSDRRVVIVRDFDRVTAKDLLLPLIENPALTTVLVLVSSKPDFRQKIFKALQQHATVVQFSGLSEDQILGWIQKRIALLGKRIIPDACQLIQSYVGRSLRVIQNEIDKLISFIGEKPTIDLDDVNAVVGMSKQFNIFELQKTIGRQNLSHSLEILDHMLDAGENPVGMIVILTRYFQKLWLVSDLQRKASNPYQLASKVSIPPAYVDEYIAAARKLSPDQIERCFSALLETDIALKSTGRDPKLLMTLLLYKLLKPELSSQSALA